MSNQFCKKLNTVGEIPDLEYQGYIWWSDKRVPERIRGKLDSKQESINPFITEGHLIDVKKNTSITIRHVGNDQLIHQFDLNLIDSVPPNQKTERLYKAHRIEDIKILKFLIVWLKENNSLSYDFEELKPAFQVFTGFEK